jgi:DNA-binding XRE family transcriptional regulator
MEQLSVTDYAKLLGVTRQAILLQIKEKRLPKNVTVKKIGNTYSLSVRGQKKEKK